MQYISEDVILLNVSDGHILKHFICTQDLKIWGHVLSQNLDILFLKKEVFKKETFEYI